MKMKKAVSPIIATVLLILITITAMLVISGFVLQTIKNTTKKTQECSEILGKISINPAYTCYNESSGEVYVDISLGADSPEIKGFLLSLAGEGIAKNFKIEKGKSYENIRVIDKAYGEEIEIVGPGEEITYIINISAIDERLKDSVTIMPITTSGYKCEEIREAIAERC